MSDDFLPRWLRPMSRPLLVLGPVAVVFLLTLPSTVQTGDSGELVAAAWRLLVPHPPGYPLFVWLWHLVLHLVPVSTVFWRASFFSAACGLAAVWIATSAVPTLELRAALAWTLGLAAVFARWTVIPDVFGLHALFVAIVANTALDAAFEKDPGRATRLGCIAAFTLALGLAHHQTLVFLAPMLAPVFLRRELPRRKLLVALASGLALSAVLYLSLLALHTRDFNSWGELAGVGDVVAHALRLEYGTFTMNRADAPSQFEAVAVRLALLTARDFLLPLACVAAALWLCLKERRSPRAPLLALTGSIALYVAVVLGLNTIEPVGLGRDISDRFLIFIFVTLTTGAAHAARHATGRLRLPRWAGWAAMALALVSPLARGPDFGQATSPVIEDYARNFLSMARSGRKTILLAVGDTRIMALRFVQAVTDLGHDVLVVPSELVDTPWFQTKLRRELPELTLASAPDLERELIAPNCERYDILVEKNFTPRARSYRITYLGLGRRVEPGAGTFFDEESYEALKWRMEAREIKAAAFEYDERLDLFASYADFDLARAVEAYSRKDLVGALTASERALDRVPYCWPALENICKLAPKHPQCEMRDTLLKQFRYF